MTFTELDLDKCETSELRKLYAKACNDCGIECRRAGKMGRNELHRKVVDLVKKGIIVRIQSLQDAGKGCTEKTKATCSEATRVVPDSVQECFDHLMEAARLFMKYDIWVTQGRKDDPKAKKYLELARGSVRSAVGSVINLKGEGWDTAGKVAYCIDRAMARLRNEFSDTLVSNCVMSALLSDEHQLAMELKKQKG